MARRRKKADAGQLIIYGIVGLVVLLATIPKEAWIAVGVLLLVSVAFYIGAQYKKSEDLAPVEEEHVTARVTRPTNSAINAGSRGRYTDDDLPVSVSPSSASSSTSSFRIPSAPKGFGNATWIPRGQSINVSGVTIPDGMVYVGTSLATSLGRNDPCLINSSKSVSSHGDYTESDMGYWPSYSDISKSSRRAYLNWLANGKRDPEANIGYVFLYFYGLERRAIIDAADNATARADRSVIGEEIRRLLSIYGEKSNSFRRYASELLDWVSLADHTAKLYEKPVPAFLHTFEVPLYVRLALGQAAVDGAPVPSPLALAWTKLEPNISLRTPAKRCGELFDRLFHQKYTEAFGAGMVLPRNKTKLKFVYRPASAGFHGGNQIKLTFGETPDVTVLTAPIKKLEKIVESTTKELEPYSRYIGKNPGANSALEGLLQLPTSLWPESATSALSVLKARIGTGMVKMSFQDLLAALGAQSTFTRDKTFTLAKTLESVNIGLEPDVLGGAKLPKPDDNVILFFIPPGEVVSHATPAYQAALLTLQLASAVAAADGDFSAKEINHLREEVQSWTHLTPNHHNRLLAHLRLLIVTPVSLTSIKKKLEPLNTAARETIAAFMATVAQSDGVVTPDEVKTLEKVYKALGVDPKKVFSNIHAVASGAKPTAATSSTIEETGFSLDPERIAALQRDTEKVSMLLASIFIEEEATSTPPPEPEEEATQDEMPKGILGLDESHTALARMLLSRPQWSRDELLDVAADLDLMLDGALEHINEASFDMYDIPFTEGDDTIEINAELLEKIEA